jgi:hypothetical protein
LTRGKRWSVEEERLLEEYVKAGVPIVEISLRLRRSIVGVRDKISHFGLKDDTTGKFVPSSSSLSSSSPGLGAKVADVAGSLEAVVSGEPSDVGESSSQPSWSVSESPDALSTPEEALKLMNYAMHALKHPGLSRLEIQRLKTMASTADKYQGLFERVAKTYEYEKRLAKMEELYSELAKRQASETNESP